MIVVLFSASVLGQPLPGQGLVVVQQAYSRSAQRAWPRAVEAQVVRRERAWEPMWCERVAGSFSPRTIPPRAGPQGPQRRARSQAHAMVRASPATPRLCGLSLEPLTMREPTAVAVREMRRDDRRRPASVSPEVVARSR